MRLDKCDTYTAKETLGYRGRKLYVSAARGAAKRKENKKGTEEETNLQTNYWSPPIRSRVEPMKKQNTENKEKDSDTYRQEAEEATGREKVGE